MESFEQLIVLMGHMIAQIASEMVQLASGGSVDDFGDADVWQNWRGDIMTTLLDAWSLVLNDPLLEGSRHSHSGGRSGVGQQLKAALKEVMLLSSLNEVGNQILTRTCARGQFAFCEQITGNVYSHLLQCVLQITATEVSNSLDTSRFAATDSLTTASTQAARETEEEEEEDVGQIESRNLDDQIKSISMIGRINLASSLAALQQRWSDVGTLLLLWLSRME